jgi:hypothetical protein
MRRLIFFLFLALFTAPDLGAQDSGNPFELTFRLSEEPAEEGPTNPFDLMPHQVPGAAEEFTAAIQTQTLPIDQLRERPPMKTSTLFIILVGALIFFTFAVGSNRAAVGRAWRSFLNDNSLTIAQRDATGLAGNTPYYMLYINFLINAGIFAFLIVQSLSNSAFNNAWFLVLCIGLSIMVFLSKHILLFFVQLLFPVQKEVQRYNFLITVFNCVLGLFLVPFNFLIAFLLEYKDFLVFWAIGLAIIFYGYRTLRAMIMGSKFLSGNQFHFLLYLCTVEIAPLMVFIKFIMNQAG